MKIPWYLRTAEDWDLEMKTGSKNDMIIVSGCGRKEEKKDVQVQGNTSEESVPNSDSSS